MGHCPRIVGPKRSSIRLQGMLGFQEGREAPENLYKCLEKSLEKSCVSLPLGQQARGKIGRSTPLVDDPFWHQHPHLTCLSRMNLHSIFWCSLSCRCGRGPFRFGNRRALQAMQLALVCFSPRHKEVYFKLVDGRYLCC